jgi:competence protein ComEC
LNIAFVALLLVLCLSFVRISGKNLELTFYSVGNADSFLIKTPQNAHIMLDTGRQAFKGGRSQAQNIMLPHLRNKRVKTLDLLIVTHFDSDHAGGVTDILNDIKVKKVLLSANGLDGKNAENIIRALNEKNINYEIVQSGALVHFEPNFQLKTFSAGFNEPKTDNEDSIITLVEAYGKSFVFMGDAGHLAFSRLKDELPKNIDLLKVGHHGAKGALDEQMVEHFKPKIAVISTGPNMYGHPNPVTIGLLENAGVKILNTDKSGAVKIVQKPLESGALEKYRFNLRGFEKLP